jgi:hypothetical protein
MMTVMTDAYVTVEMILKGSIITQRISCRRDTLLTRTPKNWFWKNQNVIGGEQPTTG